MRPRLVPELDVADLTRALRFYVDVCGFAIDHERPEEGFAYLIRRTIDLERRTYRVRGEDLTTLRARLITG